MKDLRPLIWTSNIPAFMGIGLALFSDNEILGLWAIFISLLLLFLLLIISLNDHDNDHDNELKKIKSERIYKDSFYED